MVAVEANPLLQAALLYAALGWPVVPLHTPVVGVCDCPKRDKCEAPGKHPRTMHGLDDATTDPDRVRRYWSMWPHANIGVHLERAGLMDIAPDSVEWHGEFIARGLPETLRFASGGGDGHEHYLYVRPEGCPAYRVCETGQYDILSAGYAVMPPSVGRVQSYAWIAPADGAVVTTATILAPEWAVAEVMNRTTKKESRAASADFSDDEPPVRLVGDALKRWRGELFELRHGSGEVDRSDSVFQMGVSLRDAGLASRLIEAALKQWAARLDWDKYADRADPDKPFRDVVDKLIAEQGSRPVRLSGSTSKAAPKPTSALLFETIDEFNATEDENVDWSVYGYAGIQLITTLEGKAKRSGKTTMLLSMAAAVLHHKSFLGQETTYGAVVYLTEQSGPSFKRSVRRSGIVNGDAFTLLRWGNAKDWEWPQLIPEVLVKCKAVDARLLIIDTLPQFSGVRGDSENHSGAALEVMEPLQAATTTHKLAIVISRHDRKAGGAAGDSGRGSSAFTGAVDIILHLDRPEPKPGNERHRVIESLSRFEETPDNVLIELGDDEPQSYRVLGDVDQLRMRDTSEEILAALPKSAEDAIDRDELEKRVGRQSLEIGRVVKALVSKKVVGVVMLVPEGKQRARQHFYERPQGGDDDDE